MVDKVLKVAKRLKTFTLEDITMFCEIGIDVAKKFLLESNNIKSVGNKFEYVETTKIDDKYKIINKKITCKSSDITVVEACENFLKMKQKTLTTMSYQAYKTFIYAQIIPYFKLFLLKNVAVEDIEKFRIFMQNASISERRIKNILCLLNQIIRYSQNEGYIERTCVFEVKRVANIPKRQIQVLTKEQLAQLFKITKKKYPYLLSIIQKVITSKQPLNSILTGNEQEKNLLKRKIRKDFFKIKQELGLNNYMFDDLRFCH